MKKNFAIILAIVLIGCVGPATNGPDLDPSTKTGRAASDTMPVSIGFQALTFGHAPAQMMSQENTMWTLGIEPTPKIIDLPGGTTIINAISSGDINMVYGGWGFIPPTIKGLPIKIVAGIANGGNSLVCNDPEIASVAQLKGKTIAVHGQMSTQALVLRLAAAEAGLDLEQDISIVVIDRPSQIIALTEKKSIDCIVVGEPVVSKAVEAGAYISVPHTQLYKNNQFPETWVFARTDLIDSNPEAVRQVLSAHSAAIETIQLESGDASAVLAAYYTKSGLATQPLDVADQLDTYSFMTSIDSQLIMSTIDFLHGIGLIDNTIDIDDLIDCSFGYCDG